MQVITNPDTQCEMLVNRNASQKRRENDKRRMMAEMASMQKEAAAGC